MKQFILAIAAMGCTTISQAKIWRVNNDVTKDPDFTTMALAIAGASTGDTLHVEPSATSYANSTLNKQLVIIGPGYFLADNTGLSTSTDEATIGTVTISAAAAGSTIMSVTMGATISSANNITISRCRLINATNINNTTSGTVTVNINKCFVSHHLTATNSGGGTLRLNVENNILSAYSANGNITIDFPNTGTTVLFRNNTFNSYGLFTMYNAYISNNIFCYSSNSISGSNNIVHNNLAAGANTLPAGNSNVNNLNMANVLLGGTPSAGTGDARFQLKVGSPAIAAGETLGAVTTPDCGAYGATDPYHLAGIPSVPSIYLLTVPTSVAPTANNMSVTISTRSNN